MGDLLSVGQSAIRAYSHALSVTSDNIANSQTAGYVRRTAKLAEAPAAAESPLYRNSQTSTGVTVEGVTRKIEQWLVEDARDATSTAQQAKALATWLSSAESSLGDDENGIGDAISKLFDMADALSADVTDTTRRNEFLASVQQVVDRINGAGQQMTSLKTGIAGQATQSIETIERSLNALKEINFSLQRSRAGSANSAALLDERDRLLNEIASHVAIESEVGYNGSITVRTAGPSGVTLLDNNGAADLSMTTAADGSFQFSSVHNGVTSNFTPSGGSLAGLSTASRVLTTRQGQLDSLANDFATLINNFQAAGLDGSGNAGTDLLDASGGATGLVMLHSNPQLLAAASATSGNGNILAFGGSRDTNAATTSWETITSAHAQATSSARAQEKVTGSIRDNALLARDESSAVDLDLEAAELIRYQQAYQAAARVLQVAREIMQTIFNTL